MPFDIKNTLESFRGYSNKHDVTSLEKRGLFLVPPSQNILYEDDGTLQIREGYTLYGAANAALTPIRSSYDWNTSTGVEANIRQYNTDMEVYFNDAWQAVLRDDAATWSSTATHRFAEFWNTTEKIDTLLIVDGTANIHEWTAGFALVSSTTSTTITKTGTETWAQARFFTSGTRKVSINGTLYTYTGGETTTTLTGVTPDPTGEAANSEVIQAARKTAFTSFTLPGDFANTDTKDLIAVLNNQVWLGSTTSRYVHISDADDFTTYDNAGASGTRIPDEGATLTLDSALVGFVPFEDPKLKAPVMYMTAGKDEWYQATFTKSADLSKEWVDVTRLKSSPQSAAQSQELIAKVGDEIMFVSNEPRLRSLARVENIETPQFRDLSDPIKIEFDNATFTNGHIKFRKTLLFIALPSDDKVLMYNVKEGFWEAPAILPARRLAIISGDIYLHSNSVPETYKLFDGRNDNTNPIDARAYFNYQNFGKIGETKRFNEFLTEGYISGNAEITLVLKYEFGGYKAVREYTISGADEDILFQTEVDGSIGKHPIGSQPIGSVTDSIDELGKFRIINKTSPENFFEMQVGYESNDIDYGWKLLNFGSNIERSGAKVSKIIK